MTETWVQRSCVVCGNSFRTRTCWLKGKTHGRAGRYCSVKCQRKGRPHSPKHWVNLSCKICGKIFRVKRYRKNTAVACSKACRAIYCGNLRAQLIHIRDEWDNSHQRRTWRKRVLERDGHFCQLCGTTKELEAHHIRGVTLFPHLAGLVENGITYCRQCHDSVHRSK